MLSLTVTSSGAKLNGPRPPMLEALLPEAAADFTPRHASAHWQQYGANCGVSVVSPTELTLAGSGFATLTPRSLLRRVAATYERWTYRQATADLRAFPQVWPAAEAVCATLGCEADYSLFRPACALATILETIPGPFVPRDVAIIGDGAGVLGVLMRRFWPSSRLWLVDFPTMLVFQLGLHGAMGTADQVMPLRPHEAEQLPALDLAVNIASMQEMTTGEIGRYFSVLRRRGGYFYCVNRAAKRLTDGAEIRFADYPWTARDRVLLDGLCPYYTHYVALRPLPRRAKFDGPTQHRLVRWGD